MLLSLRKLGAVLLLLVTALLLCRHVNKRLVIATIKRGFTFRQPPVVSTSANGLNWNHTRISGLPYDYHDSAFNLYSSLPHISHVKRALPQRYHQLACKGEKYYTTGVLPAFDGHSRYQIPYFGQGEPALRRHGWSRDERDAELPPFWVDTFKATPWGKPDNAYINRVYLEQNLPFVNNYGMQHPTGAEYNALYLPRSAAIIVSSSHSPAYELEKRNVPKAEIEKRIPLLHQLSDALWFEWSDICKNPETLRYYAIEGINNDIASPLMDDIFQAWRKTLIVPWSHRLTFDLNSDEGKALFASPNGIAVNWFLIHRAPLLKRRTPMVTIFNPGGFNRCMIWDMIPEGEVSSFGEPEEEGKKEGSSGA
ncbi:MAG: hypothetical protein Q9166_000662 [cf. Caloplaca sp. 2 TL-2023]